MLIAVSAFGTSLGIKDDAFAPAFARFVCLFLEGRTDHVEINGAVYVCRNIDNAIYHAVFDGLRWSHEQPITPERLAAEALPFAELALKPDRAVIRRLKAFI